MNNRLEYGALTLALSVIGVYGAWASRAVRYQNWSWLWVLASGVAAQFVWVYLVKYSRIRLVYASLFYDVLYNGVWFLALLLMGETLKPVHGLGALLIVVGLAVLGL